MVWKLPPKPDIKKLRKGVDAGLRKALRIVAPVAKVAGEATKIISTIQKPGVVAVTNAVASGLGTLSDLVQTEVESPGYAVQTFLPQGTLNAVMLKAGWPQQTINNKDNKRVTMSLFDVDGEMVQTDSTGQLWFWEEWRADTGPKIMKALDAALPPVMRLDWTTDTSKPERAMAAELTDLVPPGTAAVWARSRALMGDHRAILLEGRPGVGKTTMAQAIAKMANIGRVLILDNGYMAARTSLDLAWFSPAVIIVDDIDKVSVSLALFERIRNSCRLLICTANNGTYDSVIDAALARPARIDEVFTIAGVPAFQRAPFDRLPEAVWEKVSQWPQAYINELENRLLHTPDDLRLKDLAARLNKRTRSVEGMMGVATDQADDELYGYLYDDDPSAKLQRET